MAIVPLACIVLYSYQTSITAFRAAVEAESRQMAEGMNLRMAEVRDELDDFLGQASRYALQTDAPADQDLALLEAKRRRLEHERSELAALVESYEFIPAPAPPADAPDSPTPPLPAPKGIELESSEVPPERFVFRFRHEDEPCVDCDTSEEEHRHAEQNNPEWVENLIFEGTKIVARAVADPKSFEAELGERSPELADEVMAFVVEGGSQMIARALEDPESFERDMGEVGEHIREHVLSSIPARLRLTEAELAELELRRERAESMIGRSYAYEIREGDRVVGTMKAQVRAQDIMTAVLEASRRQEGEIPFAIDKTGVVHALSDEDRRFLDNLAVTQSGAEMPNACPDDWIVVRTEDPVSKATFGIARPVGAELGAIRRTAIWNMAIGLAVVVLAGGGVLPVTRRMTRHLSTLTVAAESLARGDLETRVAIRSRDEIGQLASAFNRMASDLDEHQNRLLLEARLRREQEVETRILEVENQRKTDELEAARSFQLSLLPAALPDHPDYDIAAAMRTATEVGGDYYDFRTTDDGLMTIAFGDATGHGAAAGTMVTVAKSLFTSAKDLCPARFLNRASAVIRTMRLGRMAMAMAVARLDGESMTLSMAGMPPLLVHRASTGEIDEVMVPGPPLGGFRETAYREVTVSLTDGDTALMISDGYPELLDSDGEPLGYERVREHFADAVAQRPERIIEALVARAEQWRGKRAQTDDMTFIVLRKV